MSTFQALRDQLSGVVAGALLAFAFLLPTLAILFVYDVYLALVVLAVALFVLAVTTALGVAQIAPQRRRYEAARRLSGELLSFIIGMSKLRVAGAEASAFASWSRGYRAQHLAGIQILAPQRAPHSRSARRSPPCSAWPCSPWCSPGTPSISP